MRVIRATIVGYCKGETREGIRDKKGVGEPERSLGGT